MDRRRRPSVCLYFNSRPSARGDGGQGSAVDGYVLFQFTPLREGRRCIVHREGSGIVFQFTPLREGRPTISVKNTSGVISIHAPPRGATRRQVLHFSHLLFQFTPLREGRPPTVCISATCTIFQFTPLREGRLLPTLTIPPPRTHFNSRPSARGDCYSFGLSFPSVFQFTPLREGRPSIDGVYGTVTEFQFTPLREGRPWLSVLVILLMHFNSRPSARGDYVDLTSDAIIGISIHAPPRGATLEAVFVAIDPLFQFTPLREGRLPRTPGVRALRGFQFTPLREGRRWILPSIPTPRYFNSRPSARGDEAQAQIYRISQVISIHAPPRGATSSLVPII